MAKHTKKKNAKNTKKDAKEEAMPPELEKLPKDVQDKLKKIKEKLEVFKDKVVEKFDKYIAGIALLPPPREGEKVDKDKISILVLVDDTDSKKMSKEELKTKLSAIIESIAKEVDKNISPQTIILSELWQACYDGKYDLLQLIALGAPVHDTGMLAAIKIAEVHKSMVLKKFERYIVSYVLAGSLVQGKATKESDIDVWIVIDDTDVKKMTRAELKDKLRAIIIGMGLEAGDMTGIKNKLNVQIWILTEFWDGLKEANPVFFTSLRDGVPFYDRGVFMPWKQLLKMGKLKPSMEAIDMYMNSGDQMLQRAHWKIKDIGMEDTYWAILTPSQAALMLFGLPPPTPRETPQLMREIFVKKEKLLEEKWVKILEKNIQVRKELEHGSKKDISGKVVDELLKNAEDYLKRIRTLFENIEKSKQEEQILHVHDTVSAIARDVLKLEGVEKVNDSELVSVFNEELVNYGKVPEKFLRALKAVRKAKNDYEIGKLTKPEVEKVMTDAGALIKFLIEFMQRKRGRELDRAKIRVKHGETYGEVILLGDKAFIIHDLDEKDKRVSVATVAEDGTLSTIKDSSLEEFEKELAKVEIPSKVFIKEKLFENLKRVFGKDVEILVNY
ncbi:nucleotidyltransferase domain-containing protein [Candidatus Woesearchaeota archaeon]|nr:nucleotidyltransferase domain-containing protein [Candidatus Woesearchaeota archaeon]MBW3022423.1 nucleotidyltransferase domain-containing protein [Candidatus Woesearchaeota archaeon]